MIELRSGFFVVYKGLQCRLLSSETLKISSVEKQSLEFGFSQYPNNPSAFYKLISKNDVVSAFNVITKAKYKGHDFQITINKLVADDDDIVLFLNNLDFKAYDLFGFNYRDDNANITVRVKELEIVWEEREPLLDFPFNEPEKVYLKRKGETPNERRK
jgi:hypothetical protein